MAIFSYIGWRIWKIRNNIIFQNKRWNIPEVISKGMLDQKLWIDANSTDKDMKEATLSNWEEKKIAEETTPKTMMEAIHKANELCCFVDASWTSAEHKARFGWMMMNPQGNPVFQGYSSIQPTKSSMEAEAYALREAIVQVKRWGFKGVNFCGNAKKLYGKLKSHHQLSIMQQWKHHELATYLRDICLIDDPDFHYSFIFIRREANHAVDEVAKQARSTSQSYVVSWNINV